MKLESGKWNYYLATENTTIQNTSQEKVFYKTKETQDDPLILEPGESLFIVSGKEVWLKPETSVFVSEATDVYKQDSIGIGGIPSDSISTIDPDDLSDIESRLDKVESDVEKNILNIQDIETQIGSVDLQIAEFDKQLWNEIDLKKEFGDIFDYYIPSQSEIDTTASNVKIISSDADWDDINNSQYDIFLVEPGDYLYTAGERVDGAPALGNLQPEIVKDVINQIRITQSGTKDNPKIIMLWNGQDVHPAQLDITQQAQVGLRFDNCEYWEVYRMSGYENDNPWSRFIEINNSKNIKVAQCHYQDVAKSIVAYTNSEDILIRHNYIHKEQWSIDNHNFYDCAAIETVVENTNEYTKNIYIVENEIKNMVDGIQTVRFGSAYNDGAIVHNNGMKIIKNLIYVTPLIYTDGSGNFTETGEYSCSENAIDLKVGSIDKEEPILIKYNILYGFRPSDNTYGNLSDSGTATGGHYDVRYTIFDNNWIYDSKYGITSGQSLTGTQPLWNVDIKNNVFYKIAGYSINFFGSQGTLTDAEYHNVFNGGKDIFIHNNFFIDTPDSAPFKLYSTENVTITKNKFTNCAGNWFGASLFWNGSNDPNSALYKYWNKGLIVTDNIADTISSIVLYDNDNANPLLFANNITTANDSILLEKAKYNILYEVNWFSANPEIKSII